MSAAKREAFEKRAAKKNNRAKSPIAGALYGVNETVYCYHGRLLYEAKVRPPTHPPIHPPTHPPTLLHPTP